MTCESSECQSRCLLLLSYHVVSALAQQLLTHALRQPGLHRSPSTSLNSPRKIRPPSTILGFYLLVHARSYSGITLHLLTQIASIPRRVHETHFTSLRTMCSIAVPYVTMRIHVNDPLDVPSIQEWTPHMHRACRGDVPNSK